MDIPQAIFQRNPIKILIPTYHTLLKTSEYKILKGIPGSNLHDCGETKEICKLIKHKKNNKI